MRNRPQDRIKLENASKHLPDLPKCSDSSEVKREFLSKHSGKFAAEFVFVEFHHLRGLGWKLEIKEMVKRKAIFQQSPQVTNQILSVPSSTLNQLFPQIQGSSYNIKARLQCRYVEWMSQMMIILSIYHLSE